MFYGLFHSRAHRTIQKNRQIQLYTNNNNNKNWSWIVFSFSADEIEMDTKQ